MLKRVKVYFIEYKMVFWDMIMNQSFSNIYYTLSFSRCFQGIWIWVQVQFENTYFLVTEWPLSVQSMQENSKVNLVRSKVPPKCSLWGTSFFRGHSASLNNIFGASVIPQPTGCDKNVLLPRSSRTITPSNLLPTVPTKTPCSLGSRSSLAWQYLLEALRIQWPFSSFDGREIALRGN